MKRLLVLVTLALGSTLALSAQDMGKKDSMSKDGMAKGTEMTGTLCDAKCVKQDAGKSACDLNCTEKSDKTMFVDDNGKATRVANPKMATGKMGKKVKVHGEMMKGKDTMKIYDVVFENAG